MYHIEIDIIGYRDFEQLEKVACKITVSHDLEPEPAIQCIGRCRHMDIPDY
jgi:hypothetical protein